MLSINLENQTIISIFQTILTGFLWFAVIDFILGLGLILIPKHLFRANNSLRQWITFRKTTQPLNKFFRLDPFIYRYPKFFGAFFVIYGLVSSYFLLFKFNLKLTVHAYAIYYFDSAKVQFIVMNLYYIFLGLSVLTLCMGALMWVNPKAFRSVDNVLNKWISVRSVMKKTEQMYLGPDKFIQKYPRMVGSIVCIATLYFIGSMFYFNWSIYPKF